MATRGGCSDTALPAAASVLAGNIIKMNRKVVRKKVWGVCVCPFVRWLDCVTVTDFLTLNKMTHQLSLDSNATMVVVTVTGLASLEVATDH